MIVCGLDPSLRNWGIAYGWLDLNTGELTDLRLDVIQVKDDTSKQVRKNSKDLHIAHSLFEGVLPYAKEAKFIFVEVPIGSQSARAMASYGICVGVLGSLRASGYTLVEVTPSEVKMAFTGDKEASKHKMITAAMSYYPDTNWPMQLQKGVNRVIESKAEHMADAIASIHAGVQTPLFTQTLQVLKGM